MKTFRIAVELECCGGAEVELEVEGSAIHYEVYRVELAGMELLGKPVNITEDLTEKDWAKVTDRFNEKVSDYWDDIHTYGDE